jgi:hypothetical protein
MAALLHIPKELLDARFQVPGAFTRAIGRVHILSDFSQATAGGFRGCDVGAGDCLVWAGVGHAFSAFFTSGRAPHLGAGGAA